MTFPTSAFQVIGVTGVKHPDSISLDDVAQESKAEN
jgi:hypothetical protein